jgi:hypothetical protein
LDGELCTSQRVDAFDGEGILTDPLDFGAHQEKEVTKVIDFRFLGSFSDDRYSVGEIRRSCDGRSSGALHG